MFELKPISKAAIPRALNRAERYRLLNEPKEAESICLDILHIDPENQEAIISLVLALTDQFAETIRTGATLELITRIQGEYERAYYTGIIWERKARAHLGARFSDANHMAYDGFREAMSWFEKAEAIRPPDNDDAGLRWNACARTIMEHRLVAKQEKREHFLLE
jgi:hypothetical protein